MKEKKRARMAPITYVATFFTLVSLGWTGYSVTDLMAAGPWGLLAAVSVDGLWAVVQYLVFKGIGGSTVRRLGWAALAAACGLLAYHGWTINPAAAVAAALPPVVAKAAWIGDIRLRRDPTALTPDQEAEINDVIRDSEYIARKTAAEVDRAAAEEIARIRAQARVTLARDDAEFEVRLERMRKVSDLEFRTPLGVPPRLGALEASSKVSDDGEGSAEVVSSTDLEAADTTQGRASVKQYFGFAQALTPETPVKATPKVTSPQVDATVEAVVKPTREKAPKPAVKPRRKAVVKPSATRVVKALYDAGTPLDAIADKAMTDYPELERRYVTQAVRRLRDKEAS